MKTRGRQRPKRGDRRNIKQKRNGSHLAEVGVRFHSLFSAPVLLCYSAFPTDKLCFYSAVQSRGFHVALRIRPGNEESLQTARTGFVIVSHDISSDGGLKGLRTQSFLRLLSFSDFLSLTHTHTTHAETHRYDLTTTTHSGFHLTAPHRHQILSLSVTLTPLHAPLFLSSPPPPSPPRLLSLPHPSQSPLFPVRELQLSTRR